MAFGLRNWRRGLAWAGVGLAVMLGGYALAGFFALPYLVQTQGWTMLSAKLGGRFHADATAFNPFDLSLSISGFSLQGADGGGLAAIGEIAVDVDVAASLKARALVASARLLRPEANVSLDKQGKLNMAFLFADGKDGASPAFPFLLTALDIEQGRLVFEDRSQGKGYKQVVAPLTLHLADLGPQMKAHFTLDAAAENQERLALEGDFTLSPFAVEGSAKLEKLRLVPLTDWLAANLPFTVSGGSFSSTLKYRYADDFWIYDANLEAKSLSLTQGGQALLGAASATTQGLRFDTKTAQLDIKALQMGEVRLNGASPAAAASITAQDFRFQYKTNRLESQAVAADRLTVSLQAQPWVEMARLAADGFSFELGRQTLALSGLTLDDIALKTPSPITDGDAFRVDALAADRVAVDIAKQSVAVGTIQGSRAVLAAWVDKDGALGLSGLPKPSTPAAASADEKPQDPAWQVKLGRVELNTNDILLRDFSFDPPTAMRLSNLNLLVKDFDSAADQPFWLGMNTALSMNGRVALEGQVKLAPLVATLKLYVDDLSLPPFQAYLDKAVRVRVVKGTLNLNADIDYAADRKPSLRWNGDVAVANFASDDIFAGRDFANWKNLRLNGVIFEDIPPHLNIQEIILAEPYLRAVIGADKRFSLVENLSPPEAAKPVPKQEQPDTPAPSKPEKAVAITTPSAQIGPEEPLATLIGSVNIHDGEADFADMTIQPTPFAAHIHELNGNIRSLSSRQDAKSDLLLEGKLNQGSTVRIAGKINPLSIKAFSDITMDFKGVNLTTLSPYSAKFAGYRIEKGKLDMNLRYKLDNGLLTAENRFVLDHLQLGERVESPDATSLPVDLAIALLKDADGKINIELPVTGDLSNPDVSLWDLLTSAASGLIGKIVAAPFTLLGSLADDGDEDLESVVFAPGESRLSEPEKDQLATIAKALQERPGLSLGVKGVADLKTDGPALAEADLARQLKNAKWIELGQAKGKDAEWDGAALGDADRSRLLTQLYRLRNPAAPELQGLKNGAVLGGDLLQSAERRLLETSQASDVDLRGLAQARGEAIRSYLVNELGLPDQRIYLLDVQLNDSGDKAIKARLSLSGS